MAAGHFVFGDRPCACHRHPSALPQVFEGEGGEDEGEHGADEQADQNGGAGEGEVQGLGGVLLNDVDVGDQQSQSGQGCGANGEALAGSSSGVAQRVQSVGALTDLFGQAAHLGDTAGVVGHGTISISCQSDAQSGQHTNTGNTDNNTGNTDNNTGSTDNNTGNTDNNTGSTDNNTGNTNTNTGNNTTTVITGKIKVSSGYLNVRKDATTNSDVVGRLYPGSAVVIYEKKTVGSMTWGRISNGWVCMDYIK